MTQPQPLPSGKIARISETAKTALKVAAKHMAHETSQVFLSKTTQQKRKAKHHQTMAKDIFASLALLKGLPLKAAQMLSIELLPPAYQNEFKKACHQAPSLNRAIVRKVLQNELKSTPEALFEIFETEAYAAASIGQVHRATLPNKDLVAVKIQYPGIDQSIVDDMSIVKNILLNLPIPELRKKKQLINTYLMECSVRFLDETNYEKEKDALQWFYENNPFPDIRIPRPVPSHCSKKVLTMAFLTGVHIDDWLATAPSQTERNHYAQRMWDFFVYCFKEKHRFHADPNPGNYLFMPNGQLGILDFGCIKTCDPNYPQEIEDVITALCKHDPHRVIAIYQHQWKIMAPNVDPKQAIEQLSFFWEWLSRPFKSPQFDFAQHPNYMAQRFDPQFRDAITIMNNTTHNFVMFDRAYMGLLSLFQKLNAAVTISFQTLPHPCGTCACPSKT